MRKIKAFRIFNLLVLAGFIFQLIEFFGGTDDKIYKIISLCLFFLALIYAFVFAKKIEGAKIEAEGKKNKQFVFVI